MSDIEESSVKDEIIGEKKGPQNKTLFEGLKETTIIMPDTAGDLLGGPLIGMMHISDKTILGNGSKLVQEYMARGMGEIPALTVAATFISENGCDCGGCDHGEYANFYGWITGTKAAVSTVGQSKDVLNRQVNEWKQYGCPGYGEGIGSWTFYEMKRMVLNTQGISKWRPFYMFDLATQIDMAWKMMETYQTAAFSILMNPGCTVENGLDACLRGIENGGGSKMASKAQIDRYTWLEKFSTTGSGYDGGMNMHYGVYESLLNHWTTCKGDGSDPAANAKLSAESTGYTYGKKDIEPYWRNQSKR